MSTRLQTRVFVALVLLFFFFGLVTIDQRPKHPGENAFFGHFPDLFRPPKHEPQPPRPIGVPLDYDANLTPPDAGLDPCTVMHPLHGFIDLRPLQLNNEQKPAWTVHGADDDHSFTLGICQNPLRDRADRPAFRDIEDASQVGAYYVDPITKEHILMGQVADLPKFVGRRLVLRYEDGTFCDSIVSAKGERLRRSTIITFRCDHEMLHKASVSQVASVHGCTYVFELRSYFVCPTAANADNLAAIWVFLFILFAACLVFFSGSFIMSFFRKHSTFRM
ncbi:mannose 6-phosphate receptor domain-containing protein [Metschnikowia bicuspidata]|uniref:Mannose 6-phosphate receptor domain-containing protein n=1 Tax=Metschnikowia bicuspidata TaxID=27322 RepID=A0A4P9ZIX5_9ASCO|nr:mannose 6-phosphate receptor domain-containing protein [Metschnikowia bicuspidata]